jgi:hypothetical protein
MRSGALSTLLCGIVLAVPLAARADISVVHTDDSELQIGGMAQGLGLGQEVDDPYKSHERAYLFLKEARLRTDGHYGDYRFYLELGLGGEDEVVAPSPGVSLGLLDLSFDIPVLGSKTTYVKVGQFKVPYGREQLTYTGDMQFADISIESLGFDVGRDVGVAVVSHPGPVTLIGGVFTGGGRDIPPDHYLPEKLGVPLVAARAVVGNLDGDPFLLTQTGPRPDHLRAAFAVNGLYTRDSLVGHSTVLNVKLVDKSLLLDSNWNPYIAKAPFSQGSWWQAGTDAAFRTPAGPVAVSGEIEGDWAGYQNQYGVVHMAGGRTQFAVSRGPFEVAARYAFMVPDKNFTVSGAEITGNEPMHEITPSLTYVIKDEMMKLVLDVPYLVHVPVFNEKGVGSYVGTEFPDESALLAKGGTVNRQNVVEGRFMFQARF